MLDLVLIVLVWVVLPVAVYRDGHRRNRVHSDCSAAAASSVLIAVVGLERAASVRARRSCKNVPDGVFSYNAVSPTTCSAQLPSGRSTQNRRHTTVHLV